MPSSKTCFETKKTSLNAANKKVTRALSVSLMDERFANGTQGRLLHWHPGATESKRRALPAYCSDLLARFCKETSLSKQEMLPDMDFMDLGARQETLNIRGEPILLQLCVVPAYALTVHKTQALSIKHLVLGCLEGVFALGQVYVLMSRVALSCKVKPFVWYSMFLF